MGNLNRQTHRIVQRRMTAEKAFATDTFWKLAEFCYTTDTNNVYIADDSRNPDGGTPQLVQELRHALIDEDFEMLVDEDFQPLYVES